MPKRLAQKGAQRTGTKRRRKPTIESLLVELIRWMTDLDEKMDLLLTRGGGTDPSDQVAVDAAAEKLKGIGDALEGSVAKTEGT